MMILVLVVGGVLGWVAHRARVQREAVAAIERAGGLVFYKWQWANNDLISNASPPGPLWLRARVGPEFLDEVAFVSLCGPEVTDAVLPHVGRLRRIEGLWLQSASVSDAGMKHLAGLTRLRELCLTDTRVSDEGIKNLARMTQLGYLEVIGTRVTDDALKALRAALPGVQIFGPP